MSFFHLFFVCFIWFFGNFDQVPPVLSASALETSPETFPFHAVINSRFVCSGVLISQEYVLCPAHCVNGTTWGAKIFIGYAADAYMQWSLYEENTQVAYSYDIQVHGKFTKIEKNLFLNDIAIIRLPSKVKFRKNIQPGILMPKEESLLLGETLVNVTGWYTDIMADISVTETSLLNQDSCFYLYGEKFFRSQQMCLEWQDDENRLNLAGNLISVKGKILGFITRSPCLSLDTRCSSHNIILNFSPYLDWISRQTDISIEKLTGADKNKSEAIQKLDSLHDLVQVIIEENERHEEQLEKLETSLSRIYNALADMKKSIENSCLVWND